MAEIDDPRRAVIQTILAAEPGDLVIPAPVTAEIDYLLRRRGGADAGRRFLEDLSDGRFQVACLGPEDHRRALSVDTAYSDLNLGLTEASIVVLAEKLRTTRLLTLDERHFRPVIPLQGGTFTLLPADLM